jgi:membrane-associated protein
MAPVYLISFLYVVYENLLSVFNPEEIVRYGGLLIIFFAVYAQTGLFFCFFLPSSAFLFVGGMFIATGQLQHDLAFVCSCLTIAAVAGCFTGYWFGRKTGPMLYKRQDSKFFKQQHLRTAEYLFKKYGHLALTVGLLFPILRTFTPIIAGIIRMNVKRFALLIFIGSLLWAPPLVTAGYLIGSVPAFKEYLHYIMFTIIVAFTIPAIVRVAKEFKNAEKELKKGR